jgi:hypothetical protein
MKPISAAEMASLRADVAALACDTSCVVKRKTSTKDAWGTRTESFSTVTTVNVGLKSPAAHELQVYAYMIGSSKAWMVKLPYGTDVRTQDHLILGSDTLVVQADVSLSSYSTLTTMLAVEFK